MSDMNEGNEVIQPPHFPFLAHTQPRPGQLEMIQDSIKALEQGGYHLAAAPTGIGKTAASLAAALQVASQQPQRKTIFFLTSRQTQHRIVVDTVRKINQQRVGMAPIRLVDMVGTSRNVRPRIRQGIVRCVFPHVQSSPKIKVMQALDYQRTWTQGTNSRITSSR